MRAPFGGELKPWVREGKLQKSRERNKARGMNGRDRGDRKERNGWKKRVRVN